MITKIADPVESSWQKALADAYKDPRALLTDLQLDPALFAEAIAARKLFPMRVPKPFVDRMQAGDPNDPLLRQVLPAAAEFIQSPGFSTDPLQEQAPTVPGLLHKYRSRALLMVRGGCAVNCRYCFRRHFPYADNRIDEHNWPQIEAYLRAHPQINEVILSGGDPLMANDDQLIRLLQRLDRLPQLRRIRIHTRLPVVIPARVTAALLSAFNALNAQVIVVLHINHPQEIDAPLQQQCQRLVDAGCWLLNQSVLLAGVNDCSDVLVRLSERLFDARIQPYYLHQLDKVAGAAHFEVADSEAQQLMRQLHAALPGFLVPRLVREQAGEASKTPIDLQMEKL